MMKKHFATVAGAALVCALLAALQPSAALGGSADYATRAADASRITHRHLLGGIGSRNTVVHEVAYPDPDDPSGPLKTADYEPVDRLWVGGLALGAKESGYGGYEYKAHGLNTGYDWINGDLSVTVALAYAFGKIENNETDTDNSVETVLLGLFASRDPESGLYYDGNIGYGRSWNRSVSMSADGGAGSREGRFRATSFALGGNVGYGFDLSLAKVTPTIGLQWARYNQQAYLESASGAGVTPNWFSKAKHNAIEVPLSVRAGTSWQLGGGMILSPEVRAAYIFGMGNRQSSVQMGAAGTPASDLSGVESGKSRARLGMGLKANFNASFDAFFDYNVELRSGYRSSNFNTGMGLSF